MRGDPFDEAVALAARPGTPAAPGAPPAGAPDGAPSPEGTADGDAEEAGSAAAAAGGGHSPGGTRTARTSRATSHTWPEARAAARRAVRRPLSPVPLRLADALHHALAAPLPALTDLPPFDTSAMDGWAVAGPGPWALDRPATATGRRTGSGSAPGTDSGPAGGEDTATGPGLLAGAAEPPAPLPDGRAVRIATGARIPPGTTAVLRFERGELQAHGARLHALHAHGPLLPGTDIRPRGQECRSGDELLPAATPVTPAVLGLAAAAGYDALTVCPRPRVDVLVLGDELLRSGTPRGGRIRDALGPMVGPWLAALGARPAPPLRLGDDADALCEAVSTSTADLIITTGGTASGPADHVHPMLRRIGATLLVDGVAVRPGHPMLLAELPSGAHLVGLPGNPLAAVSGLLTLAEPLLRALAGRPVPGSGTMAGSETMAALTDEVPGHPHDTRLVPVTAARPDGAVRPLRFAGPAMLRGVAAATALAVIPPGGAADGSRVQLLGLPWT